MNLRDILKTHYGLAIMGDEEPTAGLRRHHPKIYDHLLQFSVLNPTVPPASAEDSTAGHLLNWQHFGPQIWFDLLKGYCAPSRPNLSEPFPDREWVYGTTGKYAVRLPAAMLPPVGPRQGAPKMETFFPPITRSQDWQPLTVFGQMPKPTQKECRECRGHGWNTLKVGNPANPGEMCRFCEGTGERTHHPRLEVPGSRRWVAAPSLAALSFLPDVEWTVSDDRMYLMGRFASGKGGVVTALLLDDGERDYPQGGSLLHACYWVSFTRSRAHLQMSSDEEPIGHHKTPRFTRSISILLPKILMSSSNFVPGLVRLNGNLARPVVAKTKFSSCCRRLLPVAVAPWKKGSKG
jgi:hypothetical protein